MISPVADSVKYALLWMDAWGMKTLDYFLRVLNTWVYDLWSGDVTQDEFIDRLADLIDQQLTRAWNEGMRQNGLDPETDMLPEWEQELQDIIANEYAYVDGFAADIVAGRGGSLSPFQARAAMWANRYNDVVNRAKVATAGKGVKMEWVYNPDKEHCDTCSALNGIVAYASEWESLNVRPQSPPNLALSCGGWRCGCKLQVTQKRRSPKAYDTILNIVTVI